MSPSPSWKLALFHRAVIHNRLLPQIIAHQKLPHGAGYAALDFHPQWGFLAAANLASLLLPPPRCTGKPAPGNSQPWHSWVTVCVIPPQQSFLLCSFSGEELNNSVVPSSAKMQMMLGRGVVLFSRLLPGSLSHPQTDPQCKRTNSAM